MSGSQSMTKNCFGFILTVHTEVTLWKIWCISSLFPHMKAAQNGMVRFVYTLIQKQICITHHWKKHCSVNVVLFLLSLTVCRSPSEQWPCLTVWEMSVFVLRLNLLWSFLLHNGRGPCNLPACCAWCSSVISWIFLQSESSCSLHRLIKAGVSLWPCRRDGGASSGLHHHSALIGWVLVKWPPALGMGHCNPPLCPALSHTLAFYCPCMQVNVRS